MFGSGRLSPLVADGIAAATRSLEAEIDVLSVPVDLDHRAVIIVITGDGADQPAERLVLKVTSDLDEAARERTALALLAPQLPVPEIRFIETTNTVATTGLSYIDGDPIDHRSSTDDGWLAAAAALRSMHYIEPTGLAPTPSHPTNVQRWAESLAADAQALGLIDDAVADRFQVVYALRERPTAPSTLVHGDASPQHFLQRRGSLTGILDFGDAGVGDPAADLAVLTLWAPDRIETIVDSYLDGPGHQQDRPELLARIAFHRPLRQLAAAIWSEHQGFSPKPFIVALYEELLKPVM